MGVGEHLTALASDIPASAVLPVFVVDLETLTCIEASASNFGRAGCRILSDKVCELREVVGLRVNGLDKMLRGKITSIAPNQADVTFLFEESPQGEKRQEKRREVTIPVQVYDRDRTISMHCRIVDASRSGCRLEGPCLEALPKDISLQIRGLGLPVDGKIVWCRDGYAGIQLLWQFSSSQDVSRMRSSADGSRRLGGTANPDGDNAARKRRVRGGAFGSR